MSVREVMGLGMCSAVILAAAQTAIAACSVDGSGGFASPIVTSTAYNFGASPTLCGHTVVVTGSGGCVVNVTVDSVQSTNADCFAITRGVVLNGQGHSITCNTTACGKAIAVSTSGSSNDKVEVNDIEIDGPFSYGIHAVTGYNMRVSGADIDLAGTGGSGISGPMLSVESSRVVNGTGDGINIGCTDVIDTIVRDFAGAGVMTFSCGSTHTVVDHCFIHDNGYAVRNTTAGTDIQIKGSTIYNNTCNYLHESGGTRTCDTAPDHVSYTSTPSFVDDELAF